MNDTARSFGISLGQTIYPIASIGWMLLSLITLPFPINYVVAGTPLYIVSFYFVKQFHRFQKLGFANDCIREISEEQMEQALEELAKTRKL